jgi:hypothetical protein
MEEIIHRTAAFEIDTFPGRGSRERRRAFNRLKFSVFGGEQGWRLPVEQDGITAADDGFDGESIFVRASERGRLVGGVRVTSAKDGFPREKLFSRVLEWPCLVAVRAHLFTMNALMVTPNRRGRLFSFGGNLPSMTIGCRLACQALKLIADNGGWVVLLSATDFGSLTLFSRLGFSRLEAPVQHAGFPAPVVTMGFDLTERARIAQRGGVLRHYLRVDRRLEGLGKCGDFFRVRECGV